MDTSCVLALSNQVNVQCKLNLICISSLQKAVVAEDVKGTVLKFVELLSANGKLTHHSLSLADKICTKACSNMAEMVKYF